MINLVSKSKSLDFEGRDVQASGKSLAFLVRPTLDLDEICPLPQKLNDAVYPHAQEEIETKQSE